MQLIFPIRPALRCSITGILKKAPALARRVLGLRAETVPVVVSAIEDAFASLGKRE